MATFAVPVDFTPRHEWRLDDDRNSLQQKGQSIHWPTHQIRAERAGEYWSGLIACHSPIALVPDEAWDIIALENRKVIVSKERIGILYPLLAQHAAYLIDRFEVAGGQPDT